MARSPRATAPRDGAGEGDGEEPIEGLGEPALPKWFALNDKMDGVGFLTVARRLPSLVRHAVRMAWRAGPRGTTATVALSLLGGVFTAFGPLATTGVLEALFAEGPTRHLMPYCLPSTVRE
ncbi:hypothetical protein [Spongiactinospora rosea]|uniref:hypothetical protein n=1 Tax=Spongiactinospora rosea TaxID=2248750 RepID=UPI001CED80DD|nr:hypothetical protein [Spongiactinospora rosea]